MSNRQQLIAFLFNIQERWIMDNSKQPSMEREEAPLPLPTPFPVYPFRDDREDFIAGIGDYIISAEDYIALRDTVGFPPNKSKLKLFLIRKCNIPDLADYSFPDITETLRSYLKENVNKSSNEQKHKVAKKSSDANDNEPLAEKALAVLNLLQELSPNQALTGPKILDELDNKNIIIDQSTLTKSIIPALKPHGVRNKPRIGYYIEKN